VIEQHRLTNKSLKTVEFGVAITPTGRKWDAQLLFSAAAPKNNLLLGAVKCCNNW
jgi:hypothetical protein